MGRIHIGTSGSHYDHWRGPFYPQGMKSDDFLPFHADRVGAAEINNTFYQLPERRTLAQWRKIAPRDFIFACKGTEFCQWAARGGACAALLPSPKTGPRDVLARCFSPGMI